MIRTIVDYKKLTPKVLSMLVEKYPDGYGDDDIISFRNHKNEKIEAVEIRTEDTIYLVKVSTRLANTMTDFSEDDYEDDDAQTPIVELPEPERDDSEDDED